METAFWSIIGICLIIWFVYNATKIGMIDAAIRFIKYEMFPQKRIKIDAHRLWLINHYEHSIREGRPFMNAVLIEAIRKLRETDVHPRYVENWVVTLEKNWRTI